MLKIEIATRVEKGASVDDVYWPAHDKWDGMVKALNEGSPEGMDRAIQVSYEWAMMDNPQQYLELVLQGIILVPLLLFFLELVITLNLLLSFFVPLTYLFL